AGRDQIDLLGFQQTASPSWVDNPGTNTGGTLTLTGTLNGQTITVVFTFKDGDYTIANFKLSSDGSGGTLLSDPPASTTIPDATATPLVDTATLTTAGAAGSQT